jgi:hypothetical protein
MTLLHTAILFGCLFLAFSAGAIVNMVMSAKAMSKKLDRFMSPKTSFSQSAKALGGLADHGLAKIAVHLICGLGATVCGLITVAAVIFMMIEKFKA